LSTHLTRLSLTRLSLTRLSLTRLSLTRLSLTRLSLTQDDCHQNWVSCVRFSPNAQNPVIVSCGWDKLVKV